ncbi:MAG: GNAT family N-acetyltransferase [Bacteroidetes bacterium]|nr:GNAT family N-acetyltransferase [Bacteroidota bacterium]
MARIFLETPRLILRDWQPGDHEPYVVMNADPEVMEFFPSTMTREQTMAQISRITGFIAGNGYGFFAVERKDNRQFIGFTGLSYVTFKSDFTPCTEIGWRLSKTNWGQGFATEAAEASLRYGFGHLGLKEIFSFTSVHNQRSENVMKKIGMQKMGTFEHPLVSDGSFVKEHVLYKIARDEKLL